MLHDDHDAWNKKHQQRRKAVIQVRASPPVFDHEGDPCTNPGCVERQEDVSVYQSAKGLKASKVRTLAGWDLETGEELPGSRSECEQAENQGRRGKCAEFSAEFANCRLGAELTSRPNCSSGRQEWLPELGSNQRPTD